MIGERDISFPIPQTRRKAHAIADLDQDPSPGLISSTTPGRHPPGFPFLDEPCLDPVRVEPCLNPGPDPSLSKKEPERHIESCGDPGIATRADASITRKPVLAESQVCTQGTQKWDGETHGQGGSLTGLPLPPVILAPELQHRNRAPSTDLERERPLLASQGSRRKQS